MSDTQDEDDLFLNLENDPEAAFAVSAEREFVDGPRELIALGGEGTATGLLCEGGSGFVETSERVRPMIDVQIQATAVKRGKEGHDA